MTGNALTVRSSGGLMPVMDVAGAVARRRQLVGFVQNIMVKDVDYGAVPGTEKDTLLKPGAEKLSTFFGLVPRYEIIKSVEQWDGPEPMFYYLIRCSLYHGDELIGEADGSCNSRESRYRWRWVDEGDVPPELDKAMLKRRGGRVSEFTFAVDKAETTGKYGKPDEYWQRFRDAIEAGMAKKIRKATAKGAQYDAWEIDSTVYRVPNEDIFSLVNTVLKMAEKRALVAAVLVAVNASEFFTQDMEDLDAGFVDVQARVVTPQPEMKPPEDVDHTSDVAEAKRELDDLDPLTPTDNRPDTPTRPVMGLEDVELDYVPDWIDTDQARQWGRLYFEARSHLAFSNDFHVQGALAQVYNLDKWNEAEAGQNYREAWHLLQEHQRSKQAQPA